MSIKWSNIIAISLFNDSWISIDNSGVIRNLEPSYTFLNKIPSSVWVLGMDQPWNPPESVRINFFQFIKSCNPLNFFITSNPGLK